MEFEKWRAICASVGDVDGVGGVGDVDGVGGVGVKGSIFVWMACERGWRARVGGIAGVLT